MKVVIAGGTGQVGGIVRRALASSGHQVVVLSRQRAELEPGVRHVLWDGRATGPWAREIDGAEAVVNLAGRSVSCRYTKDNLRQMMDSRIDSTVAVGEAIAQANRPPRVWLQASTATIYAHTFGAPHDERTHTIGGSEPNVPPYWSYSVDIARRWEAALEAAETPRTRKVALRSAIVMSPDRAGAFDYLSWITRLGLGGPIAGGRQYVSWIHDADFVRAVEFLINSDMHGAVNLASPHPLPQRDFARVLRTAWDRRIGLPATKQMAAIGALILRSDTELLLKSRRVVPGRLLEEGFAFDYPEWADAAQELVGRARRAHRARTSMRRDHSSSRTGTASRPAPLCPFAPAAPEAPHSE